LFSDLQFFSSTFGLPQPDLTIFYPNGTPTYNTSMQGIQTSWAFETSLDLQWAHAMAPDARLVLVAANPAETEGVQGFPSMFKGEQYAVAHYPDSVISQSFAVTLNPLLYGLPASDFNDIVPQTFGPGAVTLANNSLFGSGIPGMAVNAH
jgi:subtilase family serine protease